MGSSMKVETASLIFAFLSIIISSVGFVWLGVYIIRFCLIMAKLNGSSQKNSPFSPDDLTYVMAVVVIFAIFLSYLVVGLGFSIVLTKGLLSKNSQLVKAYFISGVTTNTIAVLFELLTILTYNFKIISLFLFGSFMHFLILIMIRNTYLKFAAIEKSQCRKKKVDEEKNASSTL